MIRPHVPLGLGFRQNILSDDVQNTAAAGTSRAFRFDHLLHMWQVIEMGEATGAGLGTSSSVCGFTGLFVLGFSFGFILGETALELFQRQRQLIVVDFPRFATEMSAPDFRR
jgi:hypothetical protein